MVCWFVCCRPEDFGPSQLVVVDAASQKFAGLASEYHLYYVLMKPPACVAVQSAVPKGKMTPVEELDSTTNPKIL